MEKLPPYKVALETARRLSVGPLLRYLLHPQMLPQGHAFYIVVVPGYPGVKLPPQFMDKDEVTLVIQHQYRNPVIERETLFIDLCFSHVWFRCCIPFHAMQTFADHHEGFVIYNRVGHHVAPPPPEGGEPVEDNGVVSLDSFRKKKS